MAKVELEWLYNSKEEINQLSTSQLFLLDYFINELKRDPYKSIWKHQYRWHELIEDKYEGKIIYSLSLNPDNEKWTGDRFCYSIDDETKEITIFILSTATHYDFLRKRKSSYYLLNEIRSFCKTKDQRLAFNQLLNSLKFRE